MTDEKLVVIAQSVDLYLHTLMESYDMPFLSAVGIILGRITSISLDNGIDVELSELLNTVQKTLSLNNPNKSVH